MRSIITSSVALLALLPSIAAGAAGPKINAFTNIDWTKVTGTTAPVTTCTSSLFRNAVHQHRYGRFLRLRSLGLGRSTAWRLKQFSNRTRYNLDCGQLHDNVCNRSDGKWRHAGCHWLGIALFE